MCSSRQLKQILTHYQVMAPFLQFVFSFRAREEPETMAAFRMEDRLHDSDSSLKILEMERSGRRIQHCFNLITVENDETQVEWPWPLRQAATYHSFDVVNGRAFWLSLKGNGGLSKRLKKSIPEHPLLRPSALETPGSRFTAALMTHVIIFSWCAEGWPRYIDFLGGKVKRILDRVRFGPATTLSLPNRIEAEAALRRVAALSPGRSKGITAASKESDNQKKNSSHWRVVQPLKVVSDLIIKDEKMRSSAPQNSCEKTADLDFGRLYNFDQLQELEELGDMVRQSLVVIGQNINIIKEIMERYQNLMTSTQFNKHMIMDEACQAGLETFLTRSQQLIRGMEGSALRLENVVVSLGSAKDQVSTEVLWVNV